MLGVPSQAVSPFALSGIRPPPRMPSSAVTRTLHDESLMRSRSDSAEKPPNTTEWIAPIRAHASMATTASGTMGM